MHLLLLAPLAIAAVPATWGWPVGTPVKFHGETDMLTPHGARYYAARNLDAKMGRVHLGIDTTCTAAVEGKGWFITCTLDRVDANGDGWTPTEEKKVGAIFGEWNERLPGASVTFLMTRGGALREFDLKGVEGYDRTTVYIVEQQRSALHRIFSAFDQPLSANEDDWTRGWPHKGDLLIARLPGTTGTAGASVVKYKHGEDRYGLVSVRTEGHATLSPGGAVDAGTLLVDTMIGGEALFDPTTGLLAYRDYVLEARFTASSQETGADAYYFQATAIQMVYEFPKPGEAPLTVGAMRAPHVDIAPPALPEGVALVPFAELGMQPVYVKGMPEVAQHLSLPTNVVKARILVGADGVPTGVTVIQGYTTLVSASEAALKDARFPVRPQPYAVDLDLEWRP